MPHSITFAPSHFAAGTICRAYAIFVSGHLQAECWATNLCVGWANVLFGTSKHKSATNMKVATLEKSLPTSFRSLFMPMTAAYWKKCALVFDSRSMPRVRERETAFVVDVLV